MSRVRRADAETAELARRRLPAVLSPAARARVGDDAADDEWDLDLDDPHLDPHHLDTPHRADLRGEEVPPRRPAPPDADAWARARSFTRGHLGVVLVVVVLALVVAAAGVARARPTALAEPDLTPVGLSAPPGPGSAGSPAGSAPARSASGTPPAASAGSPTPTTAAGPVVHVVGAVRDPGVVRLAAGARVADGVAAAGGFGPDAVPGTLNLAQVLLDGQQVVVVGRAASRGDPPLRSEVRGPGPAGAVDAAGAGDGGGSGTTPTAGARLDLNSATATQLDALSGVGPVTAQRILDWRAAHGRFSRIEELQEVDGIGPKTFAELAPQVMV